MRMYRVTPANAVYVMRGCASVCSDITGIRATAGGEV